MTVNNRAAAHRMLKARQDNPGSDLLPSTTGEETPTTSPPSSTPPPSTVPSSTPSTPPTTTKPPSSHSSPSSSPATKSTESTPDPTTTPTSTSQSSSSSSSSSASSSSFSSLPSSSSTSVAGTGVTLNPNTTPVQFRPTLSVSHTITTTDSLGATTVSPSSTDLVASGGVKVGTVVGSIVGALGALAVIGIIVAFFLRRWRRRRGGDEDFDPTQFVRSPVLESEFRDGPTGTSPYRASTFDPTPPSMAQRGHTNMGSISSGPGMAGHGAYASTMHQRPQYTYGNNDYDTGHVRDDETSDIAHGAYSSEPKPQNVYNPEAYGSYAYSTEGNHAVQQQPYHPYQAQPLYPGYRNAAPAPALVAGAPAVPAGRSSRQSVAINDEDVYGGI